MIKRDITFIYADPVQKQVFEMIASEGEKRGYTTRLTDDPLTKCEIGWYCEHINHPQFSKFSIIMLHDIMQQYGNWPDLWLREPWNKYDIGFLPSKVWVDNWEKCSQYYYSNPRIGTFLTGWPKADVLSAYMDKNQRIIRSEEMGLDINKPTILYAPAWENDNKQDEFVQSMLKLDVNILIKQFPFPESYVDQNKNIKAMYELHKNNPRVIILNSKSNILDAIMVSDILVSDESSTMSEAVMLGKPAISVNNWLIPDVIPSRPPENNYDYIIKTCKESLTECVRDVIKNYEYYQNKAQQYSDAHYANLGHCIPMMYDIIDAVLEGHESPYRSLTPSPRHRLNLNQLISHKYITIKREIIHNYCVRTPIIKDLYRVYRNLKS